MAEVGRVRIRLPASIRPGEVIRVRTMVTHPMERIERDAQGRIIPRKYNYVHQVVVTYLGKPVVTFDTTQSVSENPAFTFTIRATDPGPLRVTFLDTAGGRYEATADIRFTS
jgi:thiosulfate oxidation carrier complex protein SoxZ